jgi:hypothetical protein
MLAVWLAVALTAAVDGGADAGGGTPPPDAAAEVAAEAAPDSTAADAGVAPEAGAAPPTEEAGAGARAAATPPVAARPVTARLRLRVLEKGTRRPLAGASVSVDAAPAGETDDEGRFAGDIAPGPHHVQVQVPGHEPIDRRIALVVGAAPELFRLAPIDSGERYETKVQATRAAGAPAVELSGDEARKTPGTSGDPLRVLASLPGVSQIVWPAALYVVRGANPGNTGFFLDGTKVPAMFHLALGPSVIHPYLIGGLDFYPGGYPASYGGFASGVVAAHTRAPPADRVRASADVTLYDAGGIMTAPFDGDRGDVAVAARYSYTGALFSALAEDAVLRYGDYQLRVDHLLGPGQVTVMAFGSLDNLGWAGASGAMEYASLQFHRLDARWRGAVGGGRLLVATALGADWSQSTLFTNAIKVRAFSVAPRLVWDRSLGRAVDLEVGADTQAQDFATEVPTFRQRQSDLANARRALTQGLFATLAFHAGRRLVIAPGLRAELFAEQGVKRWSIEPRIEARLELSDAVALKANGGRFAQMPSLPVSVPGFEGFGLADLGLQTAIGGSLGVETRLPQGLTAAVTGYYQQLRLTDVRDIAFNVTQNVDPTAPDYLVMRRGLSYGAELMVRRADQGRFFGWLSYTLSWSFRYDDNGVLGRSDWDQRHILNLVGGYRLRRGYSLGARFHYNSGRLAPIFESGGQYRELPAFYQVDLRAERRFVFDRFVLDLYADFANLTLTRETVQLANRFDPVSGRMFVDDQSFRIILPTIGVHGEF